MAQVSLAITAATLVLTYPSRQGPKVILTRRPSHLERNPGQISCPGGMIEPTDDSPYAAALRETWEELGLRLPAETPAQPLATIVTNQGTIGVQPYWVQLTASPRLRRSTAEVAAILRVPLRDLLKPETRYDMVNPRFPEQTTPAFKWRGEVIWGATKRTLDDLLEIFPLASLA